MAHIVSVAEIASLVGDPARANILEALLERRALTATELARRAGVAPQTASGHLAKLITAGLVRMEQHGRHRYHVLASAEVALMLETISQVASSRNIAATGRTIRTGPREQALQVARSCYDHMAGRLAVAVTDSMLERGQVEFGADGGSVTDEGRRFLQRFGVDLAVAGHSRRVFCRPCLDWSERRPHIAGAMGSALLQRSLDLGWVRRVDGSRALSITRAGQAGFHKTFGVRPFA